MAYEDIIAAFKKPPIAGSGAYFMPYQAPGSEADKDRRLVAPMMAGPAPIGTPTIWPYNGAALLQNKPLSYFSEVPSIRDPSLFSRSPDVADARLPRDRDNVERLGYAELPSPPAIDAISAATKGPSSWLSAMLDRGTQLSTQPEILTLTFEPKTAESAQGFADSRGKPIKTPSGKVYTPKGYQGPAKSVAASLSQHDTRGPLSKVLGLKTSGLGGLLGGFFGMGGGQQQTNGGLGLLLNAINNGGTVTQGANGPLNSLTQQSPWWLSATGQSGSNDGVNAGISGSGRYGGPSSLV